MPGNFYSHTACQSTQRRHGKNSNAKCKGITLIELLIAVAVLGLLTAIAYPSYLGYVDRVNNEIAVADLKEIEAAFERFYTVHNSYPPDLAAVGLDNMKDPWGNNYIYLRFDAKTKIGQKRKDKSLVPVNTDYDLYSMGKDGRTTKPFTAKKARDDIVRANNGGYYGLAVDY